MSNDKYESLIKSIQKIAATANLSEVSHRMVGNSGAARSLRRLRKKIESVLVTHGRNL